MTEFASLTPKTYTYYLLPDSDKNQKAKAAKKCVIKNP